MKRYRVSIFLLFFFLNLNSYYSYAGGGADAFKGFERTLRIPGYWDWGTAGHGSFDEALNLFAAANDVMVYEYARIKYQVFTRGSKNFIQMTYTWNGEQYCYTTYATVDLKQYAEDDKKSEVGLDQTMEKKVIKRPGYWEWGTFDHGSFMQAAKILNETDNILVYRPTGKIRYRLFTHSTLNYIEAEYLWGYNTHGTYTYTTYHFQ